MDENYKHRHWRWMGIAGAGQVLSTCWVDSGHIAFCNIGQNAAVLNELFLSRLERLLSVKYFQTCHQGLPQLLVLLQDLHVVLQVSGAKHKLSTLARPASPIPIPSTGSYHTLPSGLVLHGVRSTGNTKEERFLGLGNKYVCLVYPIPAATLLSTAAQRVLRKA